MAGGAAALIVRLRRATDPVERRQFRWVAWAATVLAVIYAVAFLIESLNVLPGSADWNNWVGGVVIISFVIIPIAIGIAVLKYRLYDIDIVIRKTVVFAVGGGLHRRSVRRRSWSAWARLRRVEREPDPLRRSRPRSSRSSSSPYGRAPGGSPTA